MHQPLNKCLISKNNLIANYQALTKQIETSQIAAVVKADGYGLGAFEIVQYLNAQNCNQFFVANFDEALNLCHAIKTRLNVFKKIKIGVFSGFSGFNIAQDFYLEAQALNHIIEIIPVVNTLTELEKLAKIKQRYPAFIHIDTGINRSGISYGEFDKKCDYIVTLTKQINCVGILSHLACADQPTHPLNKTQLERFLQIKKKLGSSFKYSLSASGGVFLGNAYHFNFARCGISLYGGTPNDQATKYIKPVISLYARVLQIQTHTKNTSIGYGADYLTASKERVATIGCGYNDGILRSVTQESVFYFKNQPLQIIGRISMDLVTLHVPSHVNIVEGDYVEIIGNHQKLQNLAQSMGTIDYEILCR
ncbi:MAG: alanine racemase, partial [Pseudomonadota bacterium]